MAGGSAIDFTRQEQRESEGPFMHNVISKKERIKQQVQITGPFAIPFIVKQLSSLLFASRGPGLRKSRLGNC